MSTTLETRYLDGFVRDHEWSAIQPHVTAAHELLTCLLYTSIAPARCHR